MLLFDVYETLASGPPCALHVTCFHVRHWVICACGCLEDTRDSNLARSSSTKFHPPVCTRVADAEVSGTGVPVASRLVSCSGALSFAAVPAFVLLFAVYGALAVYEALESDPRRARHVTCFVCVTAHLSVLLFGGYDVLEPGPLVLG